jgi:transcriptional regulator with PAS, ATPase and Fis domain
MEKIIKDILTILSVPVLVTNKRGNIVYKNSAFDKYNKIFKEDIGRQIKKLNLSKQPLKFNLTIDEKRGKGFFPCYFK